MGLLICIFGVKFPVILMVVVPSHCPLSYQQLVLRCNLADIVLCSVGLSRAETHSGK
jgi:hypothetical protein